MNFPVRYAEILERVQGVEPVRYAKSRNFIDGAVTYLSPYLSRGVISTRDVLQQVLSVGYKPYQIEKIIQELAWRDYWQQVWVHRKHAIDSDLRRTQPNGEREGIPTSITTHQTGIEAIDKGIDGLYATGYMHNHIRMYVASVACNMGRCHWKQPAQWMYYHLLDADWASNALSWQWVSGANSQKLYYANQENINKYCYTRQQNSFLDVEYSAFENMQVPAALQDCSLLELRTLLPTTTTPVLDPTLPTLIYNFYNLDPQWRSDMQANRILLLEPSVFSRYPVSERSIQFCIDLALANIPGIQVWVAEYSALQELVSGAIFFKEHPLNQYKGHEDARDWMTGVKGDFPSFFGFWKKCWKELS